VTSHFWKKIVFICSVDKRQPDSSNLNIQLKCSCFKVCFSRQSCSVGHIYCTLSVRLLNGNQFYKISAIWS